MKGNVKEEAMRLLGELSLAKNPDAKVFEDSHLERDLGFDSLDRMNLMFKIRERYGITITAEDYIDQRLAIVKNLLEYVASAAEA